ncbi:MAG: AsmA family protein, partial [Nitrospinaceae bacterium]|nr:AsmA family protein [Nitrospinaceae bacterium]NIR56167.1 AsmA family protein [Nitrospinaceae bacterium]NIS86623.1 AsmA family protein [Nitrospinaceae bacterium]NIT83456.1 AsmA family protein [Nitrospinaceae bacterium]NIU45661.1 AsmA family protein [Nitrospinaceae bacterium]
MTVSKKKVAVYTLAVLFLGILVTAAVVLYRLTDLEQIKKIAVHRLEEMTGRPVTIGGAELDFVRGISIRLHDVSIGGVYEGKPKFNAKSVWVVIKTLPLLDKRVEVKKIILEGFTLQLIRDAQGQMNVALLQDWMARQDDSDLFEVIQETLMHQLVVHDGEVRFHDHLGRNDRPATWIFKNIDLSVRKNILNLPYRFSLNADLVDGRETAPVAVTGTFDRIPQGGHLDQLPVEGEVRIDGFPVSRLAPYFEPAVRALPPGSRVAMESTFTATWAGGVESAGEIKFTRGKKRSRDAFRDPDAPGRGNILYKITWDRKTLQLDHLRVRSGEFEFRARGWMANAFS